MRSFRQYRLIWCLIVLSGLGVVVFLGGCESDDDGGAGPALSASRVTREAVANTNAKIAVIGYSDALDTAMDLQTGINMFVDDPNESTFQAAKDAWLRAREAYQPTEVYRFRPGPIEDLTDDGTMVEGEGPEARINGWPLGEALIDYVAAEVDGDDGQESFAAAGVASNIISDTVNVPAITIEAIKPFVELNDDRNIGTGYHAIEFLLWGQDLNQDGTTGIGGTRDATPGHRPVSDYYQNDRCTSGKGNLRPAVICQRRAAYLQVVTELLVDDLERLVDAYESYTDNDIAAILNSMGRLGFGELAGERINIARANNSQEDEHSCFSDNTHRDILLNVVGILNQYRGEINVDYYRDFESDRAADSTDSGTGIYDLLKTEDPDLAEDLLEAIEESIRKAVVIDTKAVAGTPFDQQIQEGPDNPDIKGLINALVKQTGLIEQAGETLGFELDDLEQDTEEAIRDVS